MSLSSPSDSDSDREPNSRGARVFWGNLKTPEISRTDFVNPPKTVVKSKQTQAHLRTKSARHSLQMQDDHIFNGVGQDNPFQDDNDDETLTPSRLHKDLMSEAEGGEHAEDVESPRFHNSGVNALDTPHDDKPVNLHVPSPQSLFATLKARSSDAGSESEVEEDAVLQPSSSLDSLCALADTSTTNLEDSEHTDRQSPRSPRPPRPRMQSPHTELFASNVVPRALHFSEAPSLISFDTTSLPQSFLDDSRTDSLPKATATPPNQSPWPLSATVDELLTLSPQPSKSPSPDRSPPLQQEPQVPESDFGSIPEDISIKPALQSPVLQPTSSSMLLLGNHSWIGQPGAPSGQMSLEKSTKSEVSRAAPTSIAPIIDNSGMQGPNQIATVILPPSGAQTRKRSPSKVPKGKEKADNGDGSTGESSSNTSDELHAPPDEGDNNDKVAKKERRSRARQEAEERQRRQLMSLSPTSVDVLTLLASPSRRSPSHSTTSNGGGTMIASLALDMSIPQPSTPANPLVGPNTPARRVPIVNCPVKYPDGPPPFFIRPNPVPLDDPNRTPARRVPVATPASQAGSRPLPLHDPNRTPARRVPVLAPSPSKPADSPTSCDHLTEDSHMESSKKCTAEPPPSRSPERLVETTASSSLASSSAASRVTKPLPFPIIRQATDGKKPSNPEDSSTKMSPRSSLRQHSSVSTSKTARVSSKPYSRSLGHAHSKLPKPSYSRIPVPGAVSGGSTSTNSAGPSRLGAPLANALPTRIPSPVKRRAASPSRSELPSGPSSTSAATEEKTRVITTYQRKRQRMLTEDSDSDEPPAKRPMITARSVTNGSHNKATLADSSAALTLQSNVSPARPARPLGPLLIRPVVPGTLRHYETTRNSSRDQRKTADENLRAAAKPVVMTAVTESSPPRAETPSPPLGESPFGDTDTASTVTTLSREPTLEDLPASSSAVGSSATSLADPGPELRRTTRVRKPCGPDALLVPGSANRREPIPLTRTTTLVQRGVASSSRASSKSSTRGVKPVGLPTNPRQLQALTDANTMRNQAYLADLERKVIRKDGPRPASPTTKVRTIMEKSKEESAKDREARAERRRRRGEGSNVTASSEGDDMDVLSSPLQAGQGPAPRLLPTKHMRGPGDEEEYETPVRMPKPSRLDPNKIAKNVKWDRGLARTISEWAAEQAVKRVQAERDEAAAEAIRKGCLARDPATLHLDPLGNVPEASLPLENLGHERVIVTRFVYDDDVEVNRAAKKKKS